MAVKLGEAFIALLGDAKGLKGELKTADKDLDSWAGQAGSRVNKLLETVIKGGVVVYVTRALNELKREMTEFVVEAAKTEDVRSSFQALTDDARTMLKTLREDTAGTVKDAELMRIYNEAAQGVSKTFAEQMPEALSYIRKVRRSTGADVNYLLSSYTTAVAKLSPMIADNLKVQVTLEEATRRAAEMYGVEADALSKVQLQAGMASVILEKLRNNTARIPDAANSAAEAYTRWQTTIANVKDAIGQGFLGAFRTITEGANTLATTLLPTVERLATGVGTILNKILTTASGIVRRILAAIGLDMGDLETSANTWGENIVLSLANGMARGTVAVLNVLNQVGMAIARLLRPGSPPKLLPQLDAWGRAAADVYLKGWTEGDFNILDALAGRFERSLRLPELPALKVQSAALRDVERATRAVELAQRELNEITAYYDRLLEPLNARMEAIGARRQAIQDEARLARLREELSYGGLDARDRELAMLEIEEIQTRQQVDALETERDTVVSAAEEKLKASQDALTLIQKQYQAQQALIQAQLAGAEATKKQEKALDALLDKLEQPIIPKIDASTTQGELKGMLAGIEEAFKPVQAGADALVATWSEIFGGEVIGEEGGADTGQGGGAQFSSMAMRSKRRSLKEIALAGLMALEDMIKKAMPNIGTAISTWWNETWPTIRSDVETATPEIVGAAMTAMEAEWNRRHPGLRANWQTWWTMRAIDVGTALTLADMKLTLALGTMLKSLGIWSPLLQEALMHPWETAKELLSKTWDDIRGGMIDFAVGAQHVIAAAFEAIANGVIAAANAIAQAIATLTGKAAPKLIDKIHIDRISADDLAGNDTSDEGESAGAPGAEKLPRFAKGGAFVTRGPQAIVVGDNPGGREQVRITPVGVEEPEPRVVNNTVNTYSPTIFVQDRAAVALLLERMQRQHLARVGGMI